MRVKTLICLLIVGSCLFAEFMQCKEFKDSAGQVYKKEYYEKDILKKEELFLHDLTYIKKYNAKGIPIEEGSLLKENIRHGEWKTFSDDGKLITTKTYENGIEVRPLQEITTITTRNEQVLRVINYFPDNTIKEIKFYVKDTLTPTGSWEYYSSTGNTYYLSHLEKYQAHNQYQLIRYSPTTTTQSIEYYLDQAPHGTWAYYNEGDLLYEKYFKNGIETYANGQRIEEYIYPYPASSNYAIHTMYYDDGSIMLQRSYVNGVLSTLNAQYSKGEYFLP